MYSVCKVLFLSNGDLFMEKRKEGKRKRNYCMVKNEKENKTVNINLR